MDAYPGAAPCGSAVTTMPRVLRVLRILGVVVAVGVLGTVAAGAALTSPTTKSLGSGTVGVSSCGSLAGATVAYLTQNRKVVGITVSGLPASCDGGLLSATLTNATNTNLGGGGPATVGGGAATVTGLSATPTATTPTKVFFSVVGP